MKLESFDDVRTSMARNPKRPFHLLLGNGFSMSYDPSIFSYNALHDFVKASEGKVLLQILDIVKTTNFEMVMQQLANFASFADVFGAGSDMKQGINAAAEELKRRLVEAIGTLHPEHVFKVPEPRSEACARFLKVFLDSNASVFTTNYDLLLYWIVMRNKELLEPGDGFGREFEGDEGTENATEPDWSELRWGKNKATQNVFYVHGALHLFDSGLHIVKEEYDSQSYLLDRVRSRIDEGDYPLFVTAGDGDEKLRRIRHDRYLDHCYESLSSIDGSLVSFGFGFGGSDEHILDAINRAANHGRPSAKCLRSVYIGVHSEQDREHVEGLVGRLKCKVHVFDSKTVDVWGGDTD